MAAPHLVESRPVGNSNLCALLALGAFTGLSAQRVERDIPYRSSASAVQHLDLYAPIGAAQAPVVLFIHGGSLEEAGERRSSPMYAPVCPGLVARGIVCATMDYRLSPSFRWPAMPEDVAAAVRWLEDSVASRGAIPAASSSWDIVLGAFSPHSSPWTRST
jgi:acetyl esterase/lipase